MEYSNKITQVLARATEADKAEFAHFLANNLDSAELSHDSARIRDYVAAFDRFAAPKHGEQF